MIKAIIFDCFGVLITDALKVIRDELNKKDPNGAFEIDQLVRAANLGVIEPSESNQRIAEILGTTAEAYREQIRDGEVRDERLFAYILDLKRTYKTAMLSNISVPSLQKRFTSDELNTYFDTVVASGEVGFAKPGPEIYEITADRLEVRYDECVFIDDREHFCEAARACGMKAIEYKNFDGFKADLTTLLAQ